MLLIKIILVFLLLFYLEESSMIFHLKRRLGEHDYYISKRKWMLFGWLITFLMVVVIFNLIIGILITFIIAIIYGLLVKNNHRKRERKIEFYGYKIFKFIINQISADILVSDALQSMYLIVDDLELRKVLLDVSACYSQTTQLEESLNILKKYYKGIEVNTLCVAIEQGINTGPNDETLRKMEILLFKKYIFQIKRETQLRRKRGVISVLFLCMIIVFMIAIPIGIDIMSAFNQIFY